MHTVLAGSCAYLGNRFSRRETPWVGVCGCVRESKSNRAREIIKSHQTNTERSVSLSPAIISAGLSGLILLIAGLDFYYSHLSNPESDIVLDGQVGSTSNAEQHPGEYSFSLYFLATNRGEIDGNIIEAEVERIRFSNTEGSAEEVLTPKDFTGPYDNAPIVVLNEENESDGETEYEKGSILVPAKSSKEVLIVPRIMGGKNPARRDNNFNAVQVDLSVTIRDTEQEYSIEATSGVIYAHRFLNQAEREKGDIR